MGEGGDSHFRKIQIPTYWGNYACIIPDIPRVADHRDSGELCLSDFLLDGVLPKVLEMPTIDTTERADCTLVSVRTMTNPHYLGES